MKLSDLDFEIPSKDMKRIRKGLIVASIYNENDNKLTPHPSGVYFYKDMLEYNGMSLIEHKESQDLKLQKIDFLGNTILNDIDNSTFFEFLKIIDNDEIDWEHLQNYQMNNDLFQLSKHHGLLKELDTISIMDVAIAISIIRPCCIKKKEQLIKNIKLARNNELEVNETYNIDVFYEQINDSTVYSYKKAHAIGFAYILLLDYLKKTY